jgi:formamidopyrimidine-DNA glycosylase
MPELPEVETIRGGLEKKIVGLSIKNIEVLSPKSFIGDPELILNQKIVAVKRRAKILIIDLEGDLSLIFHLKMSGQVIYEGKGRFIGGHPTKDMFSELPNKHTRITFNLSGGSKIYFNDQRRFGWVKVVADEKVKEEVQKMFGKLGPEPLEKDFSLKAFKTNLLRHKTMAIKVAILDQAVIAGVGNIYACEALFLAGIDPQTRVKDLTDLQIKKLSDSIITVLELGIKHGGSTITKFVNAEGERGSYLDFASVYNREGKPCKNCGTEIRKIKLGGRGTYFCPNCQK